MRSISDDTSWMQVQGKGPGRFLKPRRLLLGSDVGSACLAFLVTYIYFKSRGIVDAQRNITVFNCVLILILSIALLFRSREYSITKRLSSLSAIAILIRDCVVAAAITTLLGYLTQGFFTGMTTPSRMSVGLTVLVFLGVGIAARIGLGLFQNRQFEVGRGVRRILIAELGATATELLNFIARHPEIGIAAVGMLRIGNPDEASSATDGECRVSEKETSAVSTSGLPVTTITDDIPGLKQLDNTLRQLGASEVIIALDHEDHAIMPRIAHFLSLAHVPFRVVPSLFEEALFTSETLGNIDVRVVDFRVSPLDRVGRFSKRFTDLAISVLVLTILSPLILFVSVLIAVDSGLPVIFAQERVGRNGRRFVLYKFRTMVKDAESRLGELEAQNKDSTANGRIFKVERDPRITRTGSCLRRFSIDELPQFVNVIKGEMSVVGPRPPLPREVAKYEREHLGRLRVLPGITGLWQVSGRSDLTFDKMVDLDRYYVDNWSLGLDLRILLKTIRALFKREGAY